MLMSGGVILLILIGVFFIVVLIRILVSTWDRQIDEEIAQRNREMQEEMDRIGRILDQSSTGLPSVQPWVVEGEKPKKKRRRTSKGIKWVDKKPETIVGTCMVCRSTMEADVVYCATCNLPHHRECWEYVGMCSRFGCEEENSKTQTTQSEKEKPRTTRGENINGV
jgi:hypothetical protein